MEIAADREEVEIIHTRMFELIAKAFYAAKRRCFIEGSSWAGKTYSTMQFLKDLLTYSERPLICTISSESLPHLKRGCIRDFLAIINLAGEFRESCWNRSDFIYTFPVSKSVMEFVSADSGAKFTGGRRDILFCNELNHIIHSAYRQADMRTRLFTIADWNPESEFWFHEEHLADLPENEYIHAVYQDAIEFVPDAFVRDMEVYKVTDPNYYRVYALGLPGELTGLVYPYVTTDMLVEVLPDGKKFYGLDYGSLVDPCVLVANVILGDKLYSQELFYEYGVDDVGRIDKLMDACGVKMGEPIYPDPDEPLVSNELKTKYRWSMQETVKGLGSVDFGIKKVNSYFQYWTKESINSIKEQRNYRYLETAEERDEMKRPGKSVPTSHKWSHCLVAGTFVLAKRGGIPIEKITAGDEVLTRDGWHKVLFSGMTDPSAYVRTITFSDGTCLTGTDDHPIWVDGKGFIPLHTCRYGDTIDTCGKQLSTRVKGITDTPMRSIGRIEFISEVDQRRSGIFTAKFGLIIMVRFLKVFKSTIEMVTQVTMPSPTLNVCLVGGISSITRPTILNGSGIGSGSASGNINEKLASGIKPKKGNNIIAGLGALRLQGGSHIQDFVKIVTQCSQQKNRQAQQDFVPINAGHSGAVKQAWMILNVLVLIAKRFLRRISLDQRNVAPVRVLSVSEPHRQKQPVYDLTIEGAHEFYANGILVHNSMDARRYAVASMRAAVGGSRTSISDRRDGFSSRSMMTRR